MKLVKICRFNEYSRLLCILKFLAPFNFRWSQYVMELFEKYKTILLHPK
jgi:hypothetical protein